MQGDLQLCALELLLTVRPKTLAAMQRAALAAALSAAAATAASGAAPSVQSSLDASLTAVPVLDWTVAAPAAAGATVAPLARPPPPAATKGAAAAAPALHHHQQWLAHRALVPVRLGLRLGLGQPRIADLAMDALERWEAEDLHGLQVRVLGL